MIEISQQPTTSSSASNLTFEQQNIMQKTYRKNSKNDTKLKIININKMFRKCQQQQSVLENIKDVNTNNNNDIKPVVVSDSEVINNSCNETNKSLLGSSLNEWTLK
jgi:hypothetical protein